ncbi:hypothetical protein PR048_006732 [Dryococelus australis]|uniref:Uncharacterized protein n=1 Tax=Dryococelus australis TaxID=614101 RepID=A0ABQ9IBR5_9NEOP|nr:hypothetical protein PR048_006732 [Dryococelus australis]
MEQCLNANVGGTGELQENPPGIEPGSTWWEGSALAALSPRPRTFDVCGWMSEPEEDYHEGILKATTSSPHRLFRLAGKNSLLSEQAAGSAASQPGPGCEARDCFPTAQAADVIAGKWRHAQRVLGNYCPGRSFHVTLTSRDWAGEDEDCDDTLVSWKHYPAVKEGGFQACARPTLSMVVQSCHPQARRVCGNVEKKGSGKREIPEKIRRPGAPPCTIPTFRFKQVGESRARSLEVAWPETFLGSIPSATKRIIACSVRPASSVVIRSQVFTQEQKIGSNVSLVTSSPRSGWVTDLGLHLKKTSIIAVGDFVFNFQNISVRRGNSFSLTITLREKETGVSDDSMEQRRNERAGETGNPRENLPTNGIVQHDSHTQKSGKCFRAIKKVAKTCKVGQRLYSPATAATISSHVTSDVAGAIISRSAWTTCSSPSGGRGGTGSLLRCPVRQPAKRADPRMRGTTPRPSNRPFTLPDTKPSAWWVDYLPAYLTVVTPEFD